MTQPSSEPDLRVQVSDRALPLAEIEPLVTELSVTYALTVDTRSRWGGPAAGGTGWGPPEIALAIIGAEVLRRSSGDAYETLKRWCSERIARIKTRNGARYYAKGALALEFISPESEVRIVLCAPAGTSASGLTDAWSRLDQEIDALRQRYASAIPVWVYIWWDADANEWIRVDTPGPESH